MILPKYECPLHFIATAVPGSGMQGLETEEGTESPVKLSRTGQTKAECEEGPEYPSRQPQKSAIQ